MPFLKRTSFRLKRTPFHTTLAALFACGFFAPAAFAADITVDGATCTLADAITAANTDAATGGCPAGDPGADTLILSADVSLDAPDPLSTEQRNLFAALPDITSDITIRGGAASVIRRNVAYTCTADTTDPIFRFFNLTAGSLVLEDLVFEGACLAGGALDGAVLASSPGTFLTVRRVTAEGTTIPLGDGLVQGGVIHSQSESLTVLDSAFRDTRVESTVSLIQGAVIYAFNPAGSMEISRTTFQGLTADAMVNLLQGGAVYAFVNAVDLEDVTAEDIEASGTMLQGGAIYAAFADSVSLRRGVATGIQATSTGSISGAYFYTAIVDSLWVDGVEASQIVSGGTTLADGAALSVSATFTDLHNLRISDVTTATSTGVCSGGAVRVGFSDFVSLSDAIIEHAECRGSTAFGGAVAFEGVDIAAVQDCVLRENRAIFGVEADAQNLGRGGGLYSVDPLFALERCSIVGNTVAPADPAGVGSAQGGGVWTGGVGRFANLTIADNVALAGDGGTLGVDGFDALGGGLASGGLEAPQGAGASDPLLASSTISGNRAIAGSGEPMGVDGSAMGGGLFVGTGQEVNLESSLMAGNAAAEPDGTETPEDCAVQGGTFSSYGFNLAQFPGNCNHNGAGDLTGVDPLLYPLADHGCAVPLPDGSCPPTLAIDQTSPGADAGHCGFSTLNTDGRSLLRPQDVAGVVNAAEGCDIGSYEAFDTDSDGVTDLPDLCPLDFDPGQEDSDADLAGDACDACPGFDDRLDSDSDGSPDGCNLCFGDDATGDPDADGFCADSDCLEGDPDAQVLDLCGVCGGDNSSCAIFIDGFESGDTSAWSALIG
ncbi:MAG: hypothetical protein AAGM22_31800 [Acidobacteriota bacterium]